MSDDHQRRTWQRKSFHIPSRRREMNQVPDAGNAQRKMRIIRQQGFVRRRVRPAHNEIIAADNLRRLLFELRQEIDCFGARL